jgi:hypothetical protein
VTNELVVVRMATGNSGTIPDHDALDRDVNALDREARKQA